MFCHERVASQTHPTIPEKVSPLPNQVKLLEVGNVPSRRMLVASREPCILWNRSWKVLQWRTAFAPVPQHHIFPSRRNVQSFIENHASLLAAAFQRAEWEYPKRGERYSEQAPSTSHLPELCLCCCYHKCALFSACGLFCSQHLSDAYKFSSRVMSEVTRIKPHHQLCFIPGEV